MKILLIEKNKKWKKEFGNFEDRQLPVSTENRMWIRKKEH